MFNAYNSNWSIFWYDKLCVSPNLMKWNKEDEFKGKIPASSIYFV